MDKNRIVPSLILPEATCLVTLPAIQSSRSVKLQDSKQWLMDWRQARKHVFAAQTERRNQLIDTSTILNQSISEQAQALSSRKFETSKSTLEKWSNIQEHVKNFAFPSPPTSSRLLLVNDQKALNAILSPRYRRQLACQLSDNAMVRDVFSLSKSVTSNAIGCHVNASVIGKKSAVAITARQATTSIKSKIFLTETDEFLQLADSKSHRNSPQKSMCFKEPSNAQMESIRYLSHSLSQKMKLLIDLTGMLALQVLDEHKRRQLRDELESTKLVCVEMRKKLERTGVAKPQFQHNFNFLAADNADLIRRIETLHPLQLLLARTVTSLDSQDEALLKRTQSRLLTNVENVNSMARKNINQLAAENEIAEKDRKLRQKIWIEYTYVILSSYRLLAMKPKMNASHQARNAASSLIAKFLRQKTLNKTLTRQTRAARVLIKAVRNFLHLELKIRKKKDSIKIIAQFLIELRDVHPAAKTIKRFRKRVISIQKMIRHFLMRRNFLYMRMLNRWVKIEDKQRKKHNSTVQFKYEEKPSILECIRIQRLRKMVQEKQRAWLEELRKYLKAAQVYRDEREVSRMLRMQMECFMQGRALPDSVIQGLPRDTRRIYKKLNSNPPKPPPQILEIAEAEMKRAVCVELFQDFKPVSKGVKLPDVKKKTAFVEETGCKSENQRKKP